MALPVQTLKQSLRREMRAKLSQLTTQHIQQQSDQVVRSVLELPVYQQSVNVCVYLSMTNEIQTYGLLQALFLQGKKCFVPRCTPTDMEMVLVHDMADFQSLPKNKWGIPEPKMDHPRVNVFEMGGPELILMPGLAFDYQRNRLGHGKGYYDKYIKRCREFALVRNSRGPRLVALALNEQLVDATLPHDLLDEKPEQVITAGCTLD